MLFQDILTCPDGYCIYRANLPSGSYVGFTGNFRRRVTRHISDSRCVRFARAIRKYGATNIEWEIVDTASNILEAYAKEMAYITILRHNGVRLYNLTNGGNGGRGYKHTEETKRKMSAMKKGRKHSEAHRAANGAAHRGLKYPSRSVPPERRAAISRTLKAMHQSGQRKVPMQKLTAELVKEIKALLREGHLNNREIGDLYGVCADNISAIKCGVSWRHVQ